MVILSEIDKWAKSGYQVAYKLERAECYYSRGQEIPAFMHNVLVDNAYKGLYGQNYKGLTTRVE